MPESLLHGRVPINTIARKNALVFCEAPAYGLWVRPHVVGVARSLSHTFEVSQEAMTIRLTSLRWLTHWPPRLNEDS
jgi:hypothetical protein